MSPPTTEMRPTDFGPTHVASAEELSIGYHALAARVVELERWREHIVEGSLDGK